MHVVNLRHRNQEVVAVVRELLALAEEGDLSGLTFVARLGPRNHMAGVVGVYRDHPEQALLSALRLKKQLLDQE